MALTTSPGGAIVARMLVGTGDAMTFVSVLRLIPSWFPARRVPILTQVTGLLGQLGQVAATIPLVFVLHTLRLDPGLPRRGRDRRARRGRRAGRGPGLPASARRPRRRSPGARPSASCGCPSPSRARGSGCGRTSPRSSPQMVFALLWGFPFLTIGLGYSATLAGSLLTLMVLAGLVVAPGARPADRGLPAPPLQPGPRRARRHRRDLDRRAALAGTGAAARGRRPDARAVGERSGVGGRLRLRPLVQPVARGSASRRASSTSAASPPR